VCSFLSLSVRVSCLSFGRSVCLLAHLFVFVLSSHHTYERVRAIDQYLMNVGSNFWLDVMKEREKERLRNEVGI